MAVGLFVFISWAVISVFLLIPQRISKTNTLFSLFCISILTTNMFTIFELNMHLIALNQKPMMFISYCLHRNVIIPVSILSFICVYLNYNNGLKKLAAVITSYLWLMFTELLALKLGIKTHNGGNWIFIGAAFAVLMFISTLLLKWFQRVNFKEATKQ